MCSIGGHENGWPLTKWITVSTRNAKNAEPSLGGLSYQIRATEWRKGWKRRVKERETRLRDGASRESTRCWNSQGRSDFSEMSAPRLMHEITSKRR